MIRSLTRVLEKGPKSKSQIDAVIDACSEFQSLREGIVTYRARFLNAASESQRNNLQRVVIDYLERYFMLITFTSYLNTINPDKIQSQGGAAGKGFRGSDSQKLSAGQGGAPCGAAFSAKEPKAFRHTGAMVSTGE